MLLKNGSKGKDVEHVQEWLTYHGFAVKIDGDYGNATEEAVEMFQKSKSAEVTGEVTDYVYGLLELPIIQLRAVPKAAGSLRETIVLNANRHCSLKPREIGGENMGPFVREYMRGNEGVNYPWCAGSASTVVLQAYQAMNIKPAKFKYQMSCDTLYSDAKAAGTLVSTPSAGCIFLLYNPANPVDCIHTGIVTSYNAAKGTIQTAEGNTNNNGSREGFEFIPRIRTCKNMHFISLT